jgi:DNA-directed RNA polymerase subunit K/omega
MDYKKSKAPSTTITRDLIDLEKGTNNIYESIVIIAKRSDQIAIEIKKELDQKLEEFASFSDNLDETFENREQIEISKFYERLPKPTLMAIEEFKEDRIYWRRPEADSATI